jgi:hypothetical protein
MSLWKSLKRRRVTEETSTFTAATKTPVNTYISMKKFTKNNIMGFLVLEAIIALALFSICVFSTITLSWSARRMFDEAHDKAILLDTVAPIAADTLAFDSSFTYTAYGNDATIAIFASSTHASPLGYAGQASSSEFASNSISFNTLEPYTFSGFGKDTCPPILYFSNPVSPPVGTVLPISSSNLITDLVVKDNFAYISTNSSSSTDPDLFIFDISDITNPKLISSLNTGPGLAAIAIAGPYIFTTNKSSINQLQVIDIHDRSHPLIISQGKVPLDIASSTRPNGSTIFYDRGLIYLGTEKGDSPELTIWNVADPVHPQLAGTYEIGSKIEKIVVDSSHAFLASSGINQLVVLDVSNPGNPTIVTTSSPSGWQTQSGQATDLFEGEIALGRDAGGFNNKANPEFILYNVSDAPQNYLIQQSSFDEPGGIYGIVARPPHFLVLTHRSSGQLRSDDKFGTTSAAYAIAGTPTALSCDWGNVYVASNNGPSITLIKDLHE